MRKGELKRVSKNLERIATRGGTVDELIRQLENVESLGDLSRLDNFFGVVGEALASRARQLGSSEADAMYLRAHGHLFEGNMARAREILEPSAQKSTDPRLLKLWAQLPDSPRDRVERLRSLEIRLGHESGYWELVRQHAEEAGLTDVQDSAAGRARELRE